MTPRLAVTLIVAAVIAYALGRWDGVRHGATETRIETVLVERARIDTLYRTDTLRLTAWRTHWDSIRVTDTVVVDSVVYVPRWIADTTIRACVAALRDCDRLRLLNDSLYRLAREAPRTRLWDRVGLTLGYGVQFGRDRQLTHGVQVGVGIRVWP